MSQNAQEVVELQETSVVPQETEESVHQEIVELQDGTVQQSEEKSIDLDRVHIKNIPSFIGFKQFKKLLEK